MVSEGITRSDLLTKIRDILADIVEDDSLQLAEHTTAEDVSEWDSINHVKLLISLEAELAFKFRTDEVKGLRNVGDLIDLIEKKLQPDRNEISVN